ALHLLGDLDHQLGAHRHYPRLGFIEAEIDEDVAAASDDATVRQPPRRFLHCDPPIPLRPIYKFLYGGCNLFFRIEPLPVRVKQILSRGSGGIRKANATFAGMPDQSVRWPLTTT